MSHGSEFLKYFKLVAKNLFSIHLLSGMMKDMKRLLVLSLLVALCASLQPAFSANLKDVKRLKLLRMCKGCDLE
jgi:hypothetical protein